VFGFTPVKHKKYNNNFLKTVVIQLSYTKCDLIENHASEIKEIFKESFPRFNSSKGKGFEISFGNTTDANFQQIESGHNIDLRTQDGQKIINISEESISFTISGKQYLSFNNLTNELEKISSILDLCSIKNINRLAIRKINIIEFKNTENPSEILNFLINPNLIGNLDFFPNREKINQSIQTINYQDNNNYLNIKYGLNVPAQLKSELGQLIIDIDLFKQEDIDKNTFTSVLSEINSEIFNIFNWVINDNTKNLLNEQA